MKNVIVLLSLSFLWISCEDISFREAQPRGKKALREIPKQLWGRYLAEAKDGELSKDTVIITSSGYRFGYFDVADRVSELSDGASLGDSLILKFFKGYYFINTNENPEWILRAVKREKNGDLLYFQPGIDSLSFERYLMKLSREIRIDSFTVKNEKFYQIDPSPNELLKLIKKGYFSQTRLKKIN